MTLPASLSLLIPVRTTSLDFAVERLALRKHFDLSRVELIVTDDGSDSEIGESLRNFCRRHDWRYVRLETADEPFSLARARNAGLAAAHGEWVFFDDLDMVYDAGFFQKLITELDLLGKTPLDFVSLPAVYLQEGISADILAHGQMAPFIPHVLSQLAFEDPRGSEANHIIESYAPASAILALRRELALAIGGYDESFSGWGGEDRDFIFRLLANNTKLPRPKDFAETRRWNLNDTHEFAGWRALFRLHGDYMARKGHYGFHLHHPPHEWRLQTGRNNIDRAAQIAVTIELSEVSEGEHEFLLRSTLFSAYGMEGTSRAPRSQLPQRSNLSTIRARLRKLKRDPHGFFQDSRSPVLRSLSRLFPRRENEFDAAHPSPRTRK